LHENPAIGAYFEGIIPLHIPAKYYSKFRGQFNIFTCLVISVVFSLLLVYDPSFPFLWCNSLNGA
jgi:hypothetical protein